MEREAEYAAIARARIAWWKDQPVGVPAEDLLAGERERGKVRDSGQLGFL